MTSDSDSPLSSAPSTDDESMTLAINKSLKSKPTGLKKYFKPTPKATHRTPTPEPPRRAPSPPHEYTLVDNDAIAFIVCFRARFSDAFPKSLPHYGPQDIERGLISEILDPDIERLLCALLGLVLNRKKDVERGHYGKAIEEAVSGNRAQWPAAWNGANPLSGSRTFTGMNAGERVSVVH